MGQMGFTLSIAAGSDAFGMPCEGEFFKINNDFAMISTADFRGRFWFS
jgi:hypothetical protein